MLPDQQRDEDLIWIDQLGTEYKLIFRDSNAKTAEFSRTQHNRPIELLFFQLSREKNAFFIEFLW